MCLAGTESRRRELRQQLYRIVPVEGVFEVVSFPINCIEAASSRSLASVALFNAFAAMREHGSLLVYCKQGAHRPAAIAALMMMVGSGEVIERVRRITQIPV